MASGVTTGLPIGKLIYSPPTTPVTSSSVTNQLGPDAFLKLLTTQLKNQDPLHPLDSTASIAQLAQFSATQATTDLKSAFATFQSNFAVMQSAALIGKKVAVSTTDTAGNTSQVVGTVAGIAVIKGAPQFTLDDKNGKLIVDSSGNALQFPTSAILGIGG